MRIQGSLLALALVFIGIILAACNLPASTEAPPLNQSVANTAAAETILAQLTEVVETLTPAATEGPLPEPTQTAVISDITETAVPTTAPTAIPTEPAATATSPPPPTPTLDASDPKAGLGEPAFYDTFTNGNNWPLYTDKHVSFEVKDSNLVMTAFNPDHYNGWILTWPVISDYYLEMTTKTKQCSGKDQYGTMVRAVKTDQGYIGYLYGISCDGHYSLRRWNGQKYVQLVDWTPSEHINAGSNQTNRIGLMVNGNQFSMYANGKLIGEFQDDTHREGRFGVFIGSVNTPDVKVLVDEIAYWDLP
ncbi:MAG: DUF1080 domain-containing protein [Chloroflexi bacterium]|nr:DUF1080 domain-containing protein [Chloroflexota bacterium]